MPTELKIGESLFKESVKGKKSGDVVLDSMGKALEKLNKQVSIRTTQLYQSVFKKLDIDKGTGLIRNSVENLALVHEMTAGLEPITGSYRLAYGQLLRDYRADTFDMLAEKEERIEHHLGKIDMREDRKLLTPEAFGQMAVLNEKNLRKVNSLMLKWKDTVYDLFISGVTRGLDLVSFRDSFYNDTGTIKIGSSLEQESTAAAMQSITEQRTAFVRQKAKENDYDYCWNANPMDMLTKPECLQASLAGVISEKEMGSVYGFPPRYVCRCELVYTRRDWVGVNQGVNQAIRDRRKALIDDLEVAPRQKSYWYWTNPQGERVRVWAEGKKASGDVMYKEVEDKLKLVKSKTVPDYKVGRGGTPTPPVTPAPKPVPPKVTPAPAKFVPAKNIDELQDKFNEFAFGNIKFIDYSEAEALKVGNKIAEHFHDMKVRFPGLVKKIEEEGRGLRSFEIINDKNLPLSIENLTEGSKGIYLPGDFKIRIAADNRFEDVLPNRGTFFALNYDTYSVVRHEFGHHVFRTIPSVEKEWSHFLQGRGGMWLEENVSEYAAINIDEGFAEAFSYYTSPEHGVDKVRTLPKELTNVFDKLFK